MFVVGADIKNIPGEGYRQQVCCNTSYGPTKLVYY